MWEIGDLVVLRSGGFLMTISGVDDKGDVFADWWGLEESKPQRFHFKAKMLGVPIVPLHGGYYTPSQIGPKPVGTTGHALPEVVVPEVAVSGRGILALKILSDAWSFKRVGVPGGGIEADDAAEPRLPAELQEGSSERVGLRLVFPEPIKRVAMGQMIVCARNPEHGKHDEGLGCRHCGGS